MKKVLFLIAGLISSLASIAQQNVKVKTVYLKDGTSVNFEKADVDSSRVVFTPDGDSLGIKVYVSGLSHDYLYSQINYVVFFGIDTTINENKNTATDLAKNNEGWRLEFPKFYQGTDTTFEITHSTDEYGITYSLEWDGVKKANRWTCYELYEGNMQSNVSRVDDFQIDPDIPEEYQHTLADYSGSGFSRGHLCPSADRLCSSEQNAQTFYLSNMQPQWQNHNGVLWSNMETHVRDIAANYDTLYVVKAATIDNEDQIYTDIEVQAIDSASNFPGIVPRYFYMALMGYNKQTDSYTAIAYWTEHTNTSINTTDFSSYTITIDELEEKTGIDFFCNLPDEIEEQVEATVELSNW
ncbi:MAG: DNA/RNA non-specific endonuclease [Prevotella sp.]|jgi:endonuclease G